MTVLILAGTHEGRMIAQYCSDQNIAAIASLAGATRAPNQLAVPTITGGFGGADQMRSFLKAEKISRIVDATHPFAIQITLRTYNLATQMNLPYLRYERPPWTPKVGDKWIKVSSGQAIAAHVKPGNRLFLATGRQTLPEFAKLEDCKLFCRQIDRPDAPFPYYGGEYVIGRPPFSVKQEISLFEKLSIDALVVKNAGGTGSETKLVAAREMGLLVYMIERPPAVVKNPATQLDQVYAWLNQS